MHGCLLLQSSDSLLIRWGLRLLQPYLTCLGEFSSFLLISSFKSSGSQREHKITWWFSSKNNSNLLWDVGNSVNIAVSESCLSAVLVSRAHSQSFLWTFSVLVNNLWCFIKKSCSGVPLTDLQWGPSICMLNRLPWWFWCLWSETRSKKYWCLEHGCGKN